jgi:NADP-dependent 3-hydroxy acid dehydrogenase YdfG
MMAAAIRLPGGPATPRIATPRTNGALAVLRAARERVAMTTTDTAIAQSSSTLPLAGRVAVVTGASSGIGAATARRLADDGATVALVGRRGERLDEVAAGIESNARVVTIAADVSEADAVDRSARLIRAELGAVDLVCANAGAMLAAPFETADTDEWDRMLESTCAGCC